MVLYNRDVRGTIDATSFRGMCQEPGDDCPTVCDAATNEDTCVICNNVDTQPTCDGQLHLYTFINPYTVCTALPLFIDAAIQVAGQVDVGP